MAKKQENKPKAVPTLQFYAVEARDGLDVEACSTEYVRATDETQALLFYLKWFPMRAKLIFLSMPVKQIPVGAKVVCVEHNESKDKDGKVVKRAILQRKRLPVNSA